MHFVDDIGNEFILKQTPQRIISLVPSITLTIFDLGAENLLVGRTKFCIEPKGKVDSIKIVGGTKQVDAGIISSLSPDLILLNKEENTQEIYLALKEIAPVFVSEVSTLEDNYRMMLQLGQLTDKVSKAEKMVADTKLNFAQLEAISPAKKVLYLIWKDPFMTVGGDTFIHQMLEKMGCNNLFAQHSRYPKIELEDVRMMNPDFVFLSSEPYPFSERHVAEIQKAIPESKVVLVEGEYFSWHGSKILSSPNYFKTLTDSIL